MKAPHEGAYSVGIDSFLLKEIMIIVIIVPFIMLYGI